MDKDQLQLELLQLQNKLRELEYRLGSHIHNGVDSSKLAMFSAQPSSSSPPGGSDTQIQFNDNGVFGGNSGFTIDVGAISATLVLSATGTGPSTFKTLNVDSAGGADGNDLTISTANGGTGGGNGGEINITSGSGASNGADAGAINITGGSGSASGSVGGHINITSGAADTSGDITIQGANAGTSNHAGAVYIYGGDVSTGNCGSIVIEPGSGPGVGILQLLGADSTNSNSGQGTGGRIDIIAGDATAGNNGGGNIVITPGVKAGTGKDGDVLINNASAISTSATGKFLVIPNCAGTPTGTPSNNGSMVYDTTNNLLYIYNGAWKSVALT